MDTIAITATKGGVGKTTLAVHIAAAGQQAGRRVRLIDMDPQQSASLWVDARDKTIAEGAWPGGTPPALKLDVRGAFAKRLSNALTEAAAEGVDFVVIDTPPYQTTDAANAASLADLVIVPVKPGVLDLQAMSATLAMIDETGARAYGVINCAKHISPALANDAASAVEGEGVTLIPVRVHDRQDYNTALLNGLTAPEVKPDGKHAEEIGALWRWIVAELARTPKRTRKVPTQSAAPDTRAPEADQPAVRFNRFRRSVAGGEG